MNTPTDMPTISLGGLEVTRFIIGGNPFSGNSHQSPARSQEMAAWYTDERVVETLFQAQSLGLSACLSRGDEHIARVLRRYWDKGGTMRWIAQTAPEMETAAIAAQFCLDHGASACYLHGGVADNCIANERYDEIYPFVDTVHAAGIPVGIAGHLPTVFIWAEENLSLDFYMVSHYNPTSRTHSAQHDPRAAERYRATDREERVATIQRLSLPVIHYKILAAGRNDPTEAFAYTTRHMRSSDAVCVGIFTKDNPNMLAEDIALLLENLRAVRQWN